MQFFAISHAENGGDDSGMTPPELLLASLGSCAAFGLVLPLMIDNMSAFALVRHWRHTPIYEALLVQDDIYLLHVGGPSNPDDNEPLPGIEVEVAR